MTDSDAAYSLARHLLDARWPEGPGEVPGNDPVLLSEAAALALAWHLLAVGPEALRGA
jgi:hypothetical protein